MRGLIRNRSLLLSLLFAAIGGLATLYYLRQPETDAAPDTEQVVVTAGAVAAGSLVDSGDVAVERWPKGRAPADVYRSVGEVVGAYATLPLVRGELVLRSKVSAKPPGSKLAAVIPEGRVAIAVAVNDVMSTGGFIAPGDRVDVLGVVTKQASDSADVVLRDITVIAVSSAIIGTDKADAGKRETGRDNPRSLDATVTLAVTLEEARRLAQVDEVGTLRLVLRARTDGASTTVAQR